jgi:proteasome lid subunit RPN8/RPN11
LLDNCEHLLTASAQLAEIVAHLEAGKPNEACGLLAGQNGRVTKVYLMVNAAHSPVRYVIEPEALVRVIEETEERGWELVGIFHSHPGGPLFPSATDIDEAYYPDSAYVICAPDAAGGWQAKAFEIKEGRAREIPLRIET